MKQFLLIFALLAVSLFARAEVYEMAEIADFPQDSIKPAIVGYRTVYEYVNPLDSMYGRKADGTLLLRDNFHNTEAMRGLTFRDTLFYNPLYLPMIFTGKILPRGFSLHSPQEDEVKGLLIPQEKTFAPQLRKSDFIGGVRREYYRNFPDRVRYSTLNFDAVPPPVSDREVRESFNPFRELIASETSFSLQAPLVEGVEIGRKYWIRSGEHSLQFSQSYFSDNWHKGGTSNMNINNYHVLRANYKKDKVRFNNTLEWRLSVYNAPEDSVRQYRFGEDFLRYFGDFGIDAFVKGWSYSTNVEARTQLFNNFNVNSTELRSAFLSPLYVNAGVGLKYQLDKRSERVRHRRTRLNLHFAPASLNYRYVANDDVKVTRFGIEEGRKWSLDIGSTITGELIFDYNRYITWTSRLKYFTSYEKVESEFENMLNMALTNAFSTRLYVNLRFDDSVPPNPKFGYWQINQTLSFGLNYKW